MLYQVLVGIQLAGIAILFCELFYVLREKPTRAQELLLIFSLSGLVNGIGYLFELLATDQALAMQAVKFAYCGKLFIPLSMLLFALEYCRVHVPRWLERTMLTVHTAVLAIVMTCEQHTLYYTSIGFEDSGLFPHLVLTHGPVYIFYAVLMFVYMLMMPCVCLRRLRRIHDKADRRQLVYMLIIDLVPFIGYIVFLSDVTQGYDTTAICYAISALMLVRLTRSSDLLRTVALAKDEIMDSLSDGVVVLDNDDELLYANAVAYDLMPPLRKELGVPASAADLALWTKEKTPRVHRERYFRATVQPVQEQGRVHGKVYILGDVTDGYRYAHQLEEQVSVKTRQVRHIQRRVIGGLASMLGAKDDVTGNHVHRTSTYVSLLAHALAEQGVEELQSPDVLQDIVDAAPLHDIGKIAIPDAILNKPARLTPEEFEVIKTHSSVGGQMLATILQGVEEDDYRRIACQIAYHHHERWDGKGYPDGLAGANIPLPARIMAVCDVYDALVSVRSYKQPMSPEEAYRIICDGSGTQFDPMVVDAFRQHFDAIRQTAQQLEESAEPALRSAG